MTPFFWVHMVPIRPQSCCLAGAAGGDLNTVLDAIDGLPASAGVRNAFKQISPEKAGALSALGFAAATFQVRNLATRTTNLRFIREGSGEGGGGSSPLSPRRGLG